MHITFVCKHAHFCAQTIPLDEAEGCILNSVENSVKIAMFSPKY